MFARLTFIEIDPKNASEVAMIYNNEVVPAVREFQGLSEVLLLEPTDPTDQLISLTLWKSKEDADKYESSGTYRTLVDKFKDKFVTRPLLKTYRVQESNVPVV